MTSHSKVQGTLKGLAMASAVIVMALTTAQAQAQTGPRGAGPRGAGPRGGAIVRPPIRVTPPRPVIVVPPCKRGGPGITPC